MVCEDRPARGSGMPCGRFPWDGKAEVGWLLFSLGEACLVSSLS